MPLAAQAMVPGVVNQILPNGNIAVPLKVFLLVTGGRASAARAAGATCGPVRLIRTGRTTLSTRTSTRMKSTQATTTTATTTTATTGLGFADSWWYTFRSVPDGIIDR